MRGCFKIIGLAETGNQSENEQFEDYKIAHITFCEGAEKLQYQTTEIGHPPLTTIRPIEK
jgi:hypothetical protein